MPPVAANLPAQLIPLAGVEGGFGTTPAAAGSPDLFRAALAAAIGQQNPTPLATTADALGVTTPAVDAARTGARDLADLPDETVADDTANDGVGLASTTGFPVIDPTLIPGTLVNAAIGPSPPETINATGTAGVVGNVPTATGQPRPAGPAGDELPRAERLRFQFAGIPAAEPQTANPPADSQPLTDRIAPTPAPVETTPIVPPVGSAVTPPAVAAARQAQTATIPAQAPVVANLIPPPASTGPVAPDDAVFRVANPLAARATPPLADTAVNDRPATAGERFEAMADAGARLTQRGAPSPVPFAVVLDQTAPEPPATPAVVSAGKGTAPAITPDAVAAPAVLPDRASVVRNFAAPNGPVDAKDSDRAAGVTSETVKFSPPDRPSETPIPAQPVTTPPVRPGNLSPTQTLVTSETATRTAAVVAEPALARLTNDSTDDAATVVPTSANAPTATPPAPTPTVAPASATTSAQPATPAVQLADAVVTHARVVEGEGSTEFRMRLDPPDLGPVRVRLVSSGDELRGQVVVADDAVRRMIESQLPELRQRLEDAGVSVQRFDVTTDPGGFADGHRNPYRDLVPEGAGAPAPQTDGRPVPAPRRPGSGTLDVMA